MRALLYRDKMVHHATMHHKVTIDNPGRKYLSSLQNLPEMCKKRKDCLIDIVAVNDIVSVDCCNRICIYQLMLL